MHTREDRKGIICTVKNNKQIRRFDFDSWLRLNQTEACRKENFRNYFEVKFTTSQNVIFDEKFNLQGVLNFFQLYDNYFGLKLSFAKGISAALSLNTIETGNLKTGEYSRIEFVRTKLDFYARGKLIKSCQDLIDANLTTPRSIFQISLLNPAFYMIHCKYRHTICPLMFKNAYIDILYFHGMSNLFFLRNVISFTNNTFRDLNSTINELVFFNCENLVVDANLLNPSVFKGVGYITIYHPISKIDDHIFRNFRLLWYVQLDATNFRNLINKQGIKWIRAINWFNKVDLSDPVDIKRKQGTETEVRIRFQCGLTPRIF